MITSEQLKTIFCWGCCEVRLEHSCKLGKECFDFKLSLMIARKLNLIKEK